MSARPMQPPAKYDANKAKLTKRYAKEYSDKQAKDRRDKKAK